MCATALGDPERAEDEIENSATTKAQLVAAIRSMAPGTISNPIPVPGGVSILALQDTRKILTRDPRDAVLSLKQVSISFPKGMPRAEAEPVVARFGEAAKTMRVAAAAPTRSRRNSTARSSSRMA